jgi:hydroxymethylglutaryl-CoA synthase
MFSYGSGLAATMWSFKVDKSVKEIAEKSNIAARLKERVAVSPEEYSKVMKIREDHHSKGNHKPVGSSADLFPGTFYLDNIDGTKRRHYSVSVN